VSVIIPERGAQRIASAVIVIIEISRIRMGVLVIWRYRSRGDDSERVIGLVLIFDLLVFMDLGIGEKGYVYMVGEGLINGGRYFNGTSCHQAEISHSALYKIPPTFIITYYNQVVMGNNCTICD
jgi:hypothetical protein